MSLSRFNPFKKKTNINVVSLRGVIGDMGRFSRGLTIENTAPILEKAFSSKKPKLVVIQINSPGGSPVQSELIYNKIRALAEKNNVKVLTVAEDVAASGGYMLMCSGDELLANKSSIVGSIGVISASFGFKDLIEKIGVQRRVFTAGENKSFLDPFQEVKEKDVEKLIKVQKSIFENFKALVEMTRLLTLKAAKMMDEVGNKVAKNEIAMIKVAAPIMALKIIDDAIQAYGGAGVTTDPRLAQAYAGMRTLRLADGPDEVHRLTIARNELKKYL